jgi:hypothetical protein
MDGMRLAPGEPELSEIPESWFVTPQPLSTVTNTHTGTPRPAGAAPRRRCGACTGADAHAHSGVVKAARPKAPAKLVPLKRTNAKVLRNRNIKLDGLFLHTAAVSACSVFPPKQVDEVSAVADPVNTTSKLAPAVQLGMTCGTACADSPVPARAAVDPTMPSLDWVPAPLLERLQPGIPKYFVEAVGYNSAGYNPTTFMDYAFHAPHKLGLARCKRLWCDYEFYWPEVYGGSDWRGRDIYDITTFDAVPLPDGEPVAECVLIVNRYIEYYAKCCAYNRRFFLSPEGDATE